MLVKKFVVGVLETNCYIISKDGYGLIVDPGDNYHILKSYIERNNLDIEYILLTHGHIDHIGAVKKIKEYTGGKVVIHREDIEYLTDDKKNLAYLMGVSFEPCNADVVINDSLYRLENSFSISVIHTPGHSKGSVCYLLSDYLFSGDTLFKGSIGRTDFAGGNYKSLIDSIKTKLFKLKDSVKVFPGHGPATSILEEKEKNMYIK